MIQRRELDHLCVHPDYRRKGLAGQLIETAAQLPIDAELSVITFRADDPRGKAAAGLYARIGLHETEAITAFGYPCRKMTPCVMEEAAYFTKLNKGESAK